MAAFADKVVLITGASSGIGEALARELARRGAKLVLAARRVERLESLARELSSDGSRAVACVCDVTVDGDAEKAVALARSVFGSLDVVIANAGFGIVGNVERLSLEDYRRQFETNVFGVLRTVKAALSELRAARGRLALVGSVNGYVAMNGNSPYAMSKFAVRALATSLSLELAPDGISVTHVAPGFVDSEIRRVDNRGLVHSGARDPIPAWLRMRADVAARKIARAIAWRRRECVITGHGKVAVCLARWSPGMLHGLMRAFQIRARREP